MAPFTARMRSRAPMEPLASTANKKVLPMRFSRTFCRKSSGLIFKAQPLFSRSF